ncbi:hypothetical protein F0L74_03360 [Chitinophaga agrisoli]|uniref:VOC domain-containing protein n=1 Tax=Chitinophaga agrisoli TaxID=2607653 RepID=A0A5B2W036_9BACT|nr:hypothetical protein [Chitinophaga agrisoli]KAA2245011.1 hypothetical protein F0L74_03360 [Chitinophaga agrisoli]
MRAKEVHLLCNNAARQKAFYTAQLGLPLINQDETSFSIQAGHTLLSFAQTGEIKDTPYHIAFNIKPAVLPAIVPFLTAQHIPIILKDGLPVVDFPNWNAKSVYFYDAEQNILEFIARYNLDHHTTDGHFNSRHVLSVSEIGIPVDDTTAFIRELQSHSSIPVWKDYGEQFKAVGDEEGLLIVVTKGRHWYPTEHANSVLPIKVIMEQEGRPLHYDNGRYTFDFIR